MLMLSRVSETLYWMSRYMERAEHTARLLDLQVHLLLDQTALDPDQRWNMMLNAIGLAPVDGAHDALSLTHWLTFDTLNDASVLSCISSARENARHVREQISSEMWEQVNSMFFEVKRLENSALWNDQPHRFFRMVKEGAHLFQGITDSTMTNGEGWNFIQVGRYIERASLIARLLDVHFRAFQLTPLHDPIRENFLEWVSLLKSCTAYEAYCKVYTADLRPDRIAEYLLLNSDFPHTVRYSVDHLYSCLQAIARTTESKRAKHVNRLAGKLNAMLDYSSVDEIMTSGLHQILQEVQAQCAQIHSAISSAYIVYPADDFVS